MHILKENAEWDAPIVSNLNNANKKGEYIDFCCDNSDKLTL